MSEAKVLIGTGHHSMGGPGFALEIDSRDPDWVPKVVSIKDDLGETLRVPAHGYGEGYAVMRFGLGNDLRLPKSLTIQATVQKRRRIELFSRPTVVNEP